VASGLSLIPTTTNEISFYDTVAQNNLIDSYSDLEYTEYEFVVGGTYNFTEALYSTVQVTYDVFDAGEDYVYGDEDGKSYSGYVAVGYKF
jgi:hypothetical protein